jgi:nucleoside-diphosphate-sugar epimerase
MRILVIGGTGFIGPSVVRILHEQGHDLTLFHRGQTEVDLPSEVGHIHCGGDDLPKQVGWIHRLPGFVSDFKHFAPDVILYMLPWGERDSQIVMHTFTGIARRIVAISSGDVYRAYGRVRRTEPGPPDLTPLAEDSPLRERLYPYRNESPRKYDAADQAMDDYEKILAERAVMGNPLLPGTVLRLPMVYGPRDNQHRLFPYLKRMDDNRPAILLDEAIARWRWTRGYMENVAAAIALAVTDGRATGRIYNVGEPRTLSITEWVRAIGDAAGWHGEIVVLPKGRLPDHLTFNIDASQDLEVDTTRIRKELGYSEAVPLDEALARTIAWERTHPPEEIDLKQFDYAAEDAILTEL